MPLLDTDAQLSQAPSGASSGILPALLGESDVELKRLFVRRHCSATGAKEEQVVATLIVEGSLPANVRDTWDVLPDVDELIAAARRESRVLFAEPKGHSPSEGHFRKPAAFGSQESAAQLVPLERVQSGEVVTAEGEGNKLLQRLRGNRKSAAATPVVNFRKEVARAEQGDPSLRKVSFTSLVDFSVLSSGHKAEAIRKLAAGASAGALEEVHLDNVGLDIACAESLVTLLKAPRLRVLTLLDNKLNEAAVFRLARCLRDHPSIRELAIGDQNHAPLSTSAVAELLDAMETTPTLVRLRLGTVHDDALRRRYLRLETAHVEGQRQITRAGRASSAEGKPAEAHVARTQELRGQLAELESLKMRRQAGETLSADECNKIIGPAAERAEKALREEITKLAELTAKAGGASVPKPPSQPIDTPWMNEARRIASSEATSFGKPSTDEGDGEDGGGDGGAAVKGRFKDPTTHYILTGSPEWRSATKAERRAVIEAFATNTNFTDVCMSDSMIDDDLARSWATVLACPTCMLESLTLETNPISSSGIEALASALPSNTSLRELKLRNLLGRVSKEAEEALADALDKQPRLTKLPIDLRSYKAKDTLLKFLERNELRRWEEKGWNASAKERLSIGHDASWKPTISPFINPPKIDAQRRGGKHVALAAQMWDGFFGRGGTKEEGKGGDEDGLFDPISLPEVSPELLAASSVHDGRTGGGGLPFVSLGDLTKSIQQKASELMGRGGGGGDEGGKKKINLPTNPIADEVANAAMAHDESVHVEVAKFEEKKALHDKEEIELHEAHHKLAWMLESTGELPPTKLSA